MDLDEVHVIEGERRMSVSFMGRLSTATLMLVGLALIARPTLAAPLNVVEVGAPAVNCIYNTSCKIVVNDSVGDIALPGVSGKALLQSRTFTGAPGAPADGMYGYTYRVTLTEAVGVGNATCVTSLRLNVGPLKPFAYGGGAALADVYVVTSGGLGNVGIASAEQNGATITFAFKAPVCPGAIPGKGDTTFFFGITSAKAPRATTATVQTATGQTLAVAARAP
jgi:hypothetical protein